MAPMVVRVPASRAWTGPGGAGAAVRAIMAPVVEEDPDVLLTRLARLPAAGALLGRFAATPTDVYLVGGAVRDLMLGREPRELDLMIESDLEELIGGLGVTSTIYDRFGTATLELAGHAYDLARARLESYPHPGALPIVAPARVEDDLQRRDFTINAIALAVAGPQKGRLLHAAAALGDLRAGLLRVLHDASFIDDPTRLMRLALYASRLDFKIEPHTRGLATAAIGGGALDTVSGNRIGAELRQLAAEDDPVAALLGLRELGIDTALAPDFGLRDPGPARRGLVLLPPEGRRAILVLAAAGANCGPAELVELLSRLAFEAEQRDSIVEAATGARALALRLQGAVRPSELAAAVGGARVETVALAGGYGPDAAAERWISQLRRVRLEITGEDLIAAGVPTGPMIGQGLRAALAAKLDGRLQGPAEELAEALRAVSSTRPGR